MVKKSTFVARVILLAIALIAVSVESTVFYAGEIRIFAGNFEPRGWLFCDGRLLSIAENELLFNLIGTQYGGDGQVTFALPDLRGRAPMHHKPGDSNYEPGVKGGVETVSLTGNEIPPHTHSFNGRSEFATQTSPANGVFAVPFLATNYCPSSVTKTTANPSTLSATGGSQPHNNMQPYLAVNYIIAVEGIYPSST